MAISSNEKPITQQQYNDLVNRTNQAVSCADAAKQCVTDFNNNPNLNKAAVISANSICGRMQVASNLVYSNYATVNCRLCASNIAIDDTHHITSDDVSLAGITSDECIAHIHGVTMGDGVVTADGLSTTTVDAQCINAVCCISAADVEANHICAESVDVSASLNAQCAAINCLDTTNATANNLTASSATIDCASISELNIRNFATDNMDTNAITHLSNPQEITFEAADTGDYYILLPIFTNGNYFIEARNDDNTKLWSVEALNSLKNIQVRWSENAYGYIVDFKIAEDASGASVLQIHANQLNEHATLYHQSISTSNTDHPTIYSTDQLSDTEEFAVTQLAGTYIQDIIYTNTLNVKCLQMDNIEVDCVGARCHIRLTCGYDTEAPYCAILSDGSENQYIQNKDLGCGVVPTWTTPAECVEENNTNLMSSDAIYNYNGTATDCDGCTAYPISELADCTCVHGSANVQNQITSTCSCTTDACVTNSARVDRLLTVGACDTQLRVSVKWGEHAPLLTNDLNTCGDWKIVEVGTKEGFVATTDCKYVTCSKQPIIYDPTDYNLKRSDTITLACADIDNLSVHGDLYVDGTMHVDDVKTIETTGNFITTRTNCVSGLTANEVSGLVVNNYDGCDNPIAIASDCTGTVRVGEADKTETTYATAIYDKEHNTWSDGTSAITPTGVLTKWDNKSESGDLITYTNAVFTSISVGSIDNLQPVLTRNEASCMNPNGLLEWDAVNNRAVTLPNPTCNEQVLTACVTGGTSYYSGYIIRPDNCLVGMRSLNTIAPSDCTYVQSPYGVENCNLLFVLPKACFGSTEIFPEWADCDYIYFTCDASCIYYELSQVPYSLYKRGDCCYVGNLRLENRTGRVLYPYSDCPYYSAWNIANLYKQYANFAAYQVTTPTNANYCWQDKQPGVYCFASMACYNAYTGNIPENSTVYIADAESYMKAEEKF